MTIDRIRELRTDLVAWLDLHARLEESGIDGLEAVIAEVALHVQQTSAALVQATAQHRKKEMPEALGGPAKMTQAQKAEMIRGVVSTRRVKRY